MDSMAYHAALREKWDSIMSCYRLSTEAQAALTRSLRDFAGVATQVPGFEGVFTDGVLSDGRHGGLLDGDAGGLVDEDVVAGIGALDGADGKRKKLKKEKDPNLPKRPPTSYLMYANDVMQEVRSQMQPGSPVGEMMKNIAAKWKVLDEPTKSAYNQRYQMALEDWRVRVGDYKRQKGIDGGRSDDEAAAAALSTAGGAPQKKKPGRKPKNALQQDGSAPQPGQHVAQSPAPQQQQQPQQQSPAVHHGLHSFGQAVMPGMHHGHHSHFSGMPYGGSPQLSQLPDASSLAALEKKQRKRKQKD